MRKVIVGVCLLVLAIVAPPAEAAGPYIPWLLLHGADSIASPGAPAIPLAVDPTTAVNPTKVEFTPSADQDTVSPLDGTALVTRYELRVYLQATPTVVVTVQDLAKPTPVAGVIDVLLDPTAVVSKLVKDTLYLAKVAAIGPRGEGVSNASNPFGYAGTTPPGSPGTVGIKK